MSYEGHYQALCKNGHQTGFPVLYSGYGEREEQDAWRCAAWIDGKVCGAEAGWINSVDDTNGDSYGHHHMIEVTPEEIRECNFNHPHVWTAATYKPSEERYRNDEKKGWVALSSGPCPECEADADIETDKSGEKSYFCTDCHNKAVVESRKGQKY